MTPPRIVVVTMVQASDFPSAWSSLRPLSAQLSPRRERIILLNDSRDDALESALGALPYTTVLTPGVNLGVARGRNTLFAAALGEGADLVVSLDDDLYVPADYLDVVERAVESDERGFGILAPTVLRFGSFAASNPHLIDREAAISGELKRVLSSDVLRSGIDAAEVEMFYHLGVRDWREHYFSPGAPQGREMARVMAEAGIVRDRRPRVVTFLRDDERSRSIAASGGGLQRVDTVAGGVSVFNAEMLHSIGLCDERFSPFGYEDADLCIRAVTADYGVAWMPDSVILHDFLDRGDSRSAEHLNLISGRSRALLGANHLADADLCEQVAFAMSASLPDVLGKAHRRNNNRPKREQHLASIAAFAVGYLDGASASGPGLPALFDRLARLSGGLSVETRTGRRWTIDRLPTCDSKAAPRLTADITSKGCDEILTAARFHYWFPDGLQLHFEIVFSREPGTIGTRVAIHRISFEGEDVGVTANRLLRAVSRSRGGVAVNVLLSQLLPKNSTLHRLLRRLFSPNGRPRSIVACVAPCPPVRLHELATTPLGTAAGITRLGLSITGTSDDAEVRN